MIRVLLQGRLGNHLFQVAAGLALARRRGTGLILDHRLLPEVTSDLVFRRQPVLKFPFPRRLSCVALDQGCRKLTGRPLSAWRPKRVQEEPIGGFSPAFHTAPDGVELRGYFQDSRYFAPIAAELTGWFDLAPWLEQAATDFRRALASGETIGLHVRRGDYLLPAHRCWQTCGPAYYARAIARLRTDSPGARLLVISDDLDWCRTHFRDEDALYVSHPRNPYSVLVDLAVFSACTHQVIANSSYSWWGAWLNRNPGRRVLMPDAWTRGAADTLPSKDMPGAETVATEETP